VVATAGGHKEIFPQIIFVDFTNTICGFEREKKFNFLVGVVTRSFRLISTMVISPLNHPDLCCFVVSQMVFVDLVNAICGFWDFGGISWVGVVSQSPRCYLPRS
jgi:hypothetical protein